MTERDWIRTYFAPLAAAPGAAQLTDDVAELSSADGRTVITADAMVEGVHFLSSDPIASVARKLVRVNVSDVLSAGAIPQEALLVLGWPPHGTEPELAAFAEALGAELEAWGAALIGGDTVSSPGGLFLSLTLTGRCEGDAPVRRGGAHPGDDLWVTGSIGGPRLGFLARAQGEASPWTALLLEPALPPLAAARLVAGHASACIDVSDGLLGDAAMLAAASCAGIVIELTDVPFAVALSDRPAQLDLATWGDDYQLLFAVPEARRESLLIAAEAAGVRISRIGRITQEPGLLVLSQGGRVNLPETLGFEHGRIGYSATRA